MRGVSSGTAWLVGVGAALIVGVALIVAGARPPAPVGGTPTGNENPGRPAASPVGEPVVPVADAILPVAMPTGPPVRADSTNTPPALLAALAGTAGGNPALDRVAVDIPIPDPDPVVEAAPESRPPSPVPDAPIDSTPPPPPAVEPGVGAPAENEATAEASGGGGDEGLLLPPVVMKAAWLVYPKDARKRKSEGDVELRILVNETGGVAAVEVEKGSSDPMLDQAAVDAARTMKFRAARQGDRAVAVWFNYQFSFRLPSS